MFDLRDKWKKFTTHAMYECEKFAAYPREPVTSTTAAESKRQVPRGLDLVVGHEKYKDIVKRALKTEGSLNLLFVGKPASGKSVILKAISEELGGQCMFFDGTNTTNRILTDMEARRPKVILIDEFEKMRKNYKEMLLNFAETGRVKVAQQNRQFDFTIPNAKIFATANDIKRVTEPMESRFVVLHVPEYDEQEFIEIAHRMLAGTPLPDEMIEFIAREVFKHKADVRQILKIGKLVVREDTPESIEQMIKTMNEGKDQ
jgi:replication-associated recombination protein RarA